MEMADHSRFLKVREGETKIWEWGVGSWKNLKRPFWDNKHDRENQLVSTPLADWQIFSAEIYHVKI